MRWDEWAPTYDLILRDFGYSRAADEAARDDLDALLAARDVSALATPRDLADRLAARDALVLGPWIVRRSAAPGIGGSLVSRRGNLIAPTLILARRRRLG